MGKHVKSVLRYVPEERTQPPGSRRDFGLRLLELMQRRGIMRIELAIASNIDVDVLEDMENNRTVPGLAAARVLAAALGYPVSFLSPATDIDAATARDEEVYRDWLRMQRIEHGEK